MTEFRFAYPLAFILLLVPLPIYFVPALQKCRPQAGMLPYSDTRLFRGLRIGWKVRLRCIPDILRWTAWILLIIGLARPQTGRAQEVIRGQGLDIALALDISSSMAALDFEPQNRLETAKTVIADFVSGREFDRIGLVVFARNAFHQVPPTLDYAIFLQLLDQVTLVSALEGTEDRRLDGTAIGLGLASAANMLRSGASASKVIILLTDGSNNAGLDPLYAALAVAALGIRIYTIGMGRPGYVNIPDKDGNIRLVEATWMKTPCGKLLLLVTAYIFGQRIPTGCSKFTIV